MLARTAMFSGRMVWRAADESTALDSLSVRQILITRAVLDPATQSAVAQVSSAKSAMQDFRLA